MNKRSEYMKEKTGTSKVGAISKAQKAQSFKNKYAQDVFMKSSEKFRDTQKVPLMLERNHFSPTGNKKNNYLEKNGLFLRKMSHSAENSEESSMLAKRFVSSKSRGDFNENKLEKSHIVPKKRRS